MTGFGRYWQGWPHWNCRLSQDTGLLQCSPHRTISRQNRMAATWNCTNQIQQLRQSLQQESGIMESYKRPTAIQGNLELSEDLKGGSWLRCGKHIIHIIRTIYTYMCMYLHTHTLTPTIKIYKADQLHWPSWLCQVEREGRATAWRTRLTALYLRSRVESRPAQDLPARLRCKFAQTMAHMHTRTHDQGRVYCQCEAIRLNYSKFVRGNTE